MALSEIRDITHQLFPFQSPILIKKGNQTCRVIVDYKNDIFLGIFDRSGTSLEDMNQIQKIYRLVDGGVAILFENSHGAPFVHVIEMDSFGCLHAVNIPDAEIVTPNETFVSAENEEYNKLASLFRSFNKVERMPSLI